MAEILKTRIVQTNITDQQILNGLKETDKNKLRFWENVFYKRYVNYIYMVAYNLCKNLEGGEQLAQDITQETFINAFKKINKFILPDNVSTSDHSYIIKAWLGKIGNRCYLKVYDKIRNERSIQIDSLEIEDEYCPVCTEKLEIRKNFYVCPNGHHKLEKNSCVHLKELPQDLEEYDLFSSLYENESIEVSNEFKEQLKFAISKIKEDHMHILLTYASEGCISSKCHLSDDSMKYLCDYYGKSSENIRQIKKRTLDKIKSLCFKTNK